MAMLGPHGESFPSQPVDGVDGCLPGPLNERRSDVDGHVGLFDRLVDRQILPLQIGVDRHLQRAPSTDGRDEIHGHDPAASSSEIQGVVCHVKLHRRVEP